MIVELYYRAFGLVNLTMLLGMQCLGTSSLLTWTCFDLQLTSEKHKSLSCRYVVFRTRYQRVPERQVHLVVSSRNAFWLPSSFRNYWHKNLFNAGGPRYLKRWERVDFMTPICSTVTIYDNSLMIDIKICHCPRVALDFQYSFAASQQIPWLIINLNLKMTGAADCRALVIHWSDNLVMQKILMIYALWTWQWTHLFFRNCSKPWCGVPCPTAFEPKSVQQSKGGCSLHFCGHRHVKCIGDGYRWSWTCNIATSIFKEGHSTIFFSAP